MSFAALPGDTPVVLCPEVAGDPRRAWSLSADQDRVWMVWCGACRFETGRHGRLDALLAAWPLLAGQELPRMGQRLERDRDGIWMMREDLG